MLEIAQPCGYIRESQDDPGQTPEAQKAGQIAAVRALAKRDGFDGDLRIYDDWNKSGSGTAQHTRHDYARMLTAVKAGEVRAIYARSADRLYRNVKIYIDLQATCADYGVRIVTERDGIIGGDGSPMAKAFATIGATFAELESNMAKVRAGYAGATKGRNIAAHALTGCPDAYTCGEAKLHHDGRRPYGADPKYPDEAAAVTRLLALWAERGSYLGAATAANTEAIPTREGGPWSSLSVSRVVRRARPDLPHPPAECPLRPRRSDPARAAFRCPHSAGTRRGASLRGRHALSGLIHCPCKRTMTSQAPHGYRVWYCTAARTDKSHQRPYSVAERALLPWIRDEIARLRIVDPLTGGPIDAVTLETGSAAERDALAAEKGRILRQNAKGYITDAELDAGMDEITAALARLGVAETVVNLPPVDWTWTAPEMNAYLLAIVSRIDLGADLQPVWAEWRDRTLRAD